MSIEQLKNQTITISALVLELVKVMRIMAIRRQPERQMMRLRGYKSTVKKQITDKLDEMKKELEGV